MKFLKTIVIFFLFSHFIFSQNTIRQDTLLAAQYFKKADSLYWADNFEYSITYFKKAVPLYKKAKILEKVAACYNGISLNYKFSGEYQKMLSHSKKSLKICKLFLDKNSIEKSVALENIGFYNKLSGKDYHRAVDFYQKAIEIRKIKGESKTFNMANLYDEIGLTKRELYEYEEALSYYEKSLEIRLNLKERKDEFVAVSYRNIADIFILLSDYDQALNYLIKAKELTEKIMGFNHLDTAYVYFDIGAYYQSLGHYDKALESYEKCYQIQNSGLEKNTQYIGFTCSRISQIYAAMGYYEKALEYLQIALQIERTSPVKNDIWIGAYLNNIGNAYEGKEEYDKALFYYQKAYKTYLNALDPDHNRISNSFHYIGFIHLYKKEYNDALNYLSKAMNIRLKTYDENHSKIGNLHFDIGLIYQKKKQYTKALESFDKALKIREGVYGGKHPKLAECYNEIGDLLGKINDYKGAFFHFEKAINANLIADHKLSVKSESENFFDLNIYMSTLENKARLCKNRYLEQTKIEQLESSIILYQKVDSVLQKIRYKINGYKDKIQLAKKTKKIYGDIIDAQLLFNDYSKSNNALVKAFYYSEKSKSHSLKDILSDSKAKNFSRISKDLIDLEKDLKISKAFYKSKVNTELTKKEIDSSKLANFESKLFDISRRQDSLTEVLEKNYPKYHQLKYDNEVISVAEVQQKLDDKTTLLEFFTADSTTYVFTISKNNIVVKELFTPKLEEQVKEFQGAITKDYEAYKKISYELYETLVAPVKKELVGNQLIIVPDGPLWHLNFDLLLTQENPSNNPKNWPYLLKDYAISYANSATLLFRDNLEQESDTNTLQECLAFSFSGEDNATTTANVRLRSLRSAGADLPGTREEIGAIANIVDGQYFFGSEATEQNFKKHAGAYNILHLALHGDVDNERPENSKLYFTKSKDTLEDNYLYSHELFALDIPAELTVLSACNTGTGKIAKGEGIMSLGNAFQYAGTKSLLLTNWEVSDETTPKIMEYFYENLRDGKNKAEALQQAKLQFLTTTNEETNHPYYWGGFYLLGDTAAIELHSDISKYWWIGFGVFILILVSLFWYRKKSFFF